MRVCIDIQSAVAPRAGIGRYTKMLVEHLAAQRLPSDELALFYHDFMRRGLSATIPGTEERAFRLLPGRALQAAWKTIHWPPFDWFSGSADVFHFPNFIRPPLARGKAVVTIHDVSFLRMPETTEEKNLRYLTSCIRDTVARADAIIADSEFTRREIIELLNVPPERVTTILLGIEPPASRKISNLKSQVSNTPSPITHRPFLFAVGTLEPRKNYPFLIDVFDRLNFDGDLVIAGGRGWKFDPILARIAASPKRDRIRVLDYVTDEQLDQLYRDCDLFIFPSLYEGFGFPPLEAMARGAPVVSSTAASLPEVVGDAALSIPGYNADEWAAKISALLGDSAARAKLAACGPAQAAKFTWSETARITWELYRQIA